MENLLRDSLKPVPLSRHPLWQRQRKAYAGSGPEIFKSIPNAATNSPVFARQLAAFLAERGGLDILEVGCGTGQFAYYLVRELYRRVGSGFRYRLHDLSPTVRRFLREHRCWQSWLDRGLVSVVDSLEPTPVLLGNYLLGSLRQERIRFREGCWQRALVGSDPFIVVGWEEWSLPPPPPDTEAPSGEYLYPVEAVELLENVQEMAIFSGKGYPSLTGDVYSEAEHGEVSSRICELEFLTRAWPGEHHYLCDTSPLFSTLVLQQPGASTEEEISSPAELMQRWERLESVEESLGFLEEVEGFPQALCDLGRRLGAADPARMLRILRLSEQLHYPLWKGHATHRKALAKLFAHFGDREAANRWEIPAERRRGADVSSIHLHHESSREDDQSQENS